MENLKLPKPHEILNKALLRKKQINQAYSQRALARDMGVSSVFVTKILTGKRSIPTTRIKKLCKHLDMDITAETSLLRSILFHSLPSNDLRQLALSTSLTKTSSLGSERVSYTKFSVLNHWYNLAILNILTCEIDTTPNHIALKLGLHKEEVERVLLKLKQAELATETDGQWKKVVTHGYFPAAKTKSEIRNFHKQMITKAFEELSKTSDKAFEERMISGYTIACDPSKVETAKRMVSDFLSEISEYLSNGTCTEVYQCNVQLFPLSKTGEQK